MPSIGLDDCFGLMEVIAGLDQRSLVGAFARNDWEASDLMPGFDGTEVLVVKAWHQAAVTNFTVRLRYVQSA